MLRVYVAGPYSADNVVGVLNNMRAGMRDACLILQNGMAPFTPWHDYHHQLMLREDEELTVQNYYDYSMAWLDVSDVVYVQGDYQKSKGTMAEIDRARYLGIPVFFSMVQLLEYKKNIELLEIELVERIMSDKSEN